ncbi:MAG: HPr family phosphocarrier protein [Candidatus Njordarchaeia archaeon]
MSPRLTAKLKILNSVGLHARPATLFVKTCKKFKSNISICKNGECRNAKKILQVLDLDVVYGDEIELIIDGEDAEEAMKTLTELINNKFGEE